MSPDLKSVTRHWWSDSCEDRWKYPCNSGDEASIVTTKTWMMASQTKGTQMRRKLCWNGRLIISARLLAHAWHHGKF